MNPSEYDKLRTLSSKKIKSNQMLSINRDLQRKALLHIKKKYEKS